ncbi:hypothetical protein D3C76_1414470 [compost metagenome]
MSPQGIKNRASIGTSRHDDVSNKRNVEDHAENQRHHPQDELAEHDVTQLMTERPANSMPELRPVILTASVRTEVETAVKCDEDDEERQQKSNHGKNFV